MIKKIQELLKNNTYSEKIEQRLEKDLEVVYKRLLTGQYEYHDYSDKNIFRVDERTQDFFLYLKSYAESGYLWEKIFRNLEIEQYGSVVDMCCGWAPKLTLALYYSGYGGRVVLLDQSQKALDELGSFMNLVFRPKYTIEKVCTSLQTPPTEKYSCIIANHIIDDLLLDTYCKENNLDTTNLYLDEKYLKKIWGLIEKDSLFLKKIPKEFANTFDAFIIKGGIICLSQYESMMESILKNSLSVQISISILSETIKEMGKIGYTNISQQALKGIGGISPQEYIILKK